MSPDIRPPSEPFSPEFLAYVAASRARQGLPPTVQDPATLERAAAALRLANVESVLTRRKRRCETALVAQTLVETTDG